jgi:hypothetical protein
MLPRCLCPWAAFCLVASMSCPSAHADPPTSPPVSPPVEIGPASPPVEPPAAPPPPPAEPTSATPVEPPGPVYQPLEHRGFYDAQMFGAGVIGLVGDGPGGPASLVGAGGSVAVLMGGTPLRGLAVGGLARVTMAGGMTFHGGPLVTASVTPASGGAPSAPFPVSGNSSATLTEIAPFLDWFPDPASGWHLGASAGLGILDVRDDAGESMSSTTFAGSIFGGYQRWVGPHYSVGVVGVLSGATRAGFQSDETSSATGYSLAPVSFELAIMMLEY